MTPVAILVEDDTWNWMWGEIVQDVVKLAFFHSNSKNWNVNYTLVQEGQQIDVDTPMLLMIPTGFVETSSSLSLCQKDGLWYIGHYNFKLGTPTK